MKKLALVVLMLSGCGAQQVRVEPVKIEPIHITVDVNLREQPKPPPK